MLSIIYSPNHRRHHPQYEVYDGVQSEYPEVPERIETIKNALTAANLGRLYVSKVFPRSHLLAVHARQYVRFLQSKSAQLPETANFFASYFLTDTYAPLTHGTFLAARDAANIALTGAERVLQGERLVYSLCRPPGHHADATSMGGYCYINNAAVAAEYLSKKGRVAILDIDYHHGNGTQHIFYDRSDVLYVSLHADPSKKYPYISGFVTETGIGRGQGYTINYPLPLKASERLYLMTVRKALKDIRRFAPDFLILSAGFDTYIHDPIGGFSLTVPFYKKIGQEIAMLGLPTLIIQEGGYHVGDLGKIAVSLLSGLNR